MIDRAWAEAFACDRIASWNAHDIERILAHYADEFEMTSPLIVQRFGIASGRLKGRAAIRDFWSKGLSSTPLLHFELRDVAVGVSSVAIIYDSATLGRIVVERIEFDDRHRGIRAEALRVAPRSMQLPGSLPPFGDQAAFTRSA